jgi:hypothetical protein
MTANYEKGDPMDVSSSSGSGQIDILKKATEVQESQVLKILDSADKLTQDNLAKEDVARKTGVGSNLNVTG